MHVNGKWSSAHYTATTSADAIGNFQALLTACHKSMSMCTSMRKIAFLSVGRQHKNNDRNTMKLEHLSLKLIIIYIYFINNQFECKSC